MVYAIIVYDVQADRTPKFLKYLRRYLTHVQNSVFEGELTEGTLVEVKETLQSMLEEEESVMVYRMDSGSYVERSVYGDDPMDDQQFL
ncbi:CRISPR-associated protein Cas2 (plasmid) [Haloarcula marismortui ATCC 43049]|uniref:CRISPR-associated endoribonuclease Cas2 n=1 Tax=Haloarcula marismortui (strain ATCC 43049 / DSM 3752 / JCM 8966 / VKM B-1809) TaxID=272569 RepID=Q5V7X4_HALMA|nr:CRISPR-associated endonuclease Cas2 [Haloarcula marismortui]AAV44427.1 CRISPR-associated protein Cas2 [Haloarcula marismortui ATCC 43049]